MTNHRTTLARNVWCMLIACTGILLFPVSQLRAQLTPQALKVVVKLLTGAAAAESLSKSAQAYERRDFSKATVQQESETIRRLREQGIEANNAAVYSAMFSLDTNSNAVWWADYFSKADPFFLVDIEGQGTFLAPQIRYNYQGGPILDRVVAKDIPPGRRVVVRVMDDDTLSDEIWKSILRTRVDLTLDANAKATQYVQLSANVNGKLSVQLLPNAAPVVIDAPDQIATMSFLVPNTSDGRWVANGDLFDGNNTKVGTLQFSSVWNAQSEILAQTNKVNTAQQQQATSTRSMVFWGVFGAVLIVVFFSMFANKSKPSDGGTEQKP